MTKIIDGVGKDAEIEVNEKGGKQSKVPYNFVGMDAKAMFEMAKVLYEGKLKYGDDENWRKIPPKEHINHLITHAFAALAGDESDEHYSHMMCRAMFACAVWLEEQQKAQGS